MPWPHAGPDRQRSRVPPLEGLLWVSPSPPPSLQEDAHCPRCCLLYKELNTSEGARTRVRQNCKKQTEPVRYGSRRNKGCSGPVLTHPNPLAAYEIWKQDTQDMFEITEETEDRVLPRHRDWHLDRGL
mmetsp:Transcript_71822/g.120100  ORF Transcript_71822/g.120100 Transcript_71822/m.120100 type:complete len:128 (-) Transcript_71822:132-515(-)